MKRTMLILVSLSVCILLTGCCLSHEWQEATCEMPKTCAKCGETEGEALGHTWQEATCTAPKTCFICGGTEGEALPHTWQEATCTEAKTCSVCAETEGKALGHRDLTEATHWDAPICGICGEEAGEPLTPDFVKYNVKGRFFEEGETVDYYTQASDHKGIHTIGELRITNYETLKSDKKHPAKEGYEWKILDVKIEFRDYNARTYGIGVRAGPDDYYNLNTEGATSGGEKVSSESTVIWKGKEYKDCLYRATLDFFASKNAYCHIEYRLPVGYDGRFIMFFDYGTDPEGKLLYEIADDHSLFFRLD